ncbi:WD40 repeat domain-containing protein, partial [Saccharomyces eubayanus]|uniref:WD40 repeat domain-containing protein n=1 Tax=Saccharomyces eubayanus TaxID=1080349 RepID=UPI0006C1612B
MSGDSADYNVGYPIYGAKFINEDTLLVAGGGGQFNSSFQNKITALKINFQKKKHIRRFREITLESIDDAPASLDCNNNLILIGCNELIGEPSMEDVNHHLRKFVFEQEHLKFVASIDFNRTTDPSVFTKFIYINQSATVAAIASSEVPTVIRIIDPRTLTENYEIETGKEVNDLHFAPNGILLSYITSNSLEVASVRDGKFVARKTDFDETLILSNVRFLNDNTLLVAASLSNSDGVSLLKLGVNSQGIKILKTASFMFDLNGITSMDVSPNKEFVGLSSNDNSIAIINIGKLKLAKLVPRVHESTITRVTFSPDSRYLASTSMGNTINVLKLSNNSSSFLHKVWKFFVNFVLLVVLAGAVQLGYKYNVHGLLYTYAQDVYKAKFKENNRTHEESSSYFTINDATRDITITADIVSVTELTRDIDTELSSFDTSAMITNRDGEPSSVWISASSVLQSSSVDAHTSVIPSSHASSEASEFVTVSEGSVSSRSPEKSATNESIFLESTPEVNKSITSSIVETIPVSPSAEVTPSSLGSAVGSPESSSSLGEKTHSTFIEQQSEEQRTMNSINEAETTSSEFSLTSKPTSTSTSTSTST